MKVAVFTHHVGSSGLKPSGQYGGGELLTLGWLSALKPYYDLMAVCQNGVYPNFDQAGEYGISGLDDLAWRPLGDSADWLRQYDVLINISHSAMVPPIARRNILVVMFPQHPEWDVSGYDTICAISEYSAKWIKRYWGREAQVIYPLLPVQDTIRALKKVKEPRKKNIVAIGRFFNVPFGNNKNHSTIIAAFQGMYRPDWTLSMIGSAQDPNYFNEVKLAAAGDDRIYFYHDLNREQYLRILAQSCFLWHAAGYEATAPSGQEHFGIIAVEAMAAGLPAFVYNNGGAPEIDGVLTWDKPHQLTEKTVEMIQQYDQLKPEYFRKKAMAFDIARNTRNLLEVIEDPAIVLYNQPEQGKIYVGDPKPGDIKVGIISDDPNITTGFAAVSRSIAKGLIAKGFRCAILGVQNPIHGKTKLVPEDVRKIAKETFYDPQLPTPKMMMKAFEAKLADIELCTTWRGHPGDPSGMSLLRDFLDVEQPDVLYLNYDPGNIRNMIDNLAGSGFNIPMVVYLPIEGKPVIPQYIELIRKIKVLNGEPILYTKWGAEAVAEAGGPHCQWIHHGADHANFRMLDEETRRELRLAIGWQNKKVMMFVGRNKRSKGITHLIQAAKILKSWKRDDIIWYIHTYQWDNMPNSSFPLDQAVVMEGLEDVVYFPQLDHQIYGVPYDEPMHLQISEADKNNIRKMQRHYLDTLSMIERYNVADVFVNAAELEGHGLPYLEAMGCGLPVISVDDEGVQREVLGKAPIYVPTKHRDHFHTWVWLSQCDPKDLAQAIVDLVDNPELYQEVSRASLEHYQQFKWQKTVDLIAQTIIDRYIT